MQECLWAIGTSVGGTDISTFTSVGQNVTGINDQLDGILQNGITYYVTIKCFNSAGLEYVMEDTEGMF